MNIRYLHIPVLAIAAVIAAIMPAESAAQRYYSPNVSIGAKAGMTMSQISFAPSIRQSMIQGSMAGLTFRYTEERNFGLIAELNIEQRGWKEDFEELPFEYSRTLTYIQLPLLTHIYFGSRKFKGFVNLGPEFGYMIASGTKSNLNYSDIASVPDFPSHNRMTEQLTTEVKNKFDYGISAGLGMEYFIKRRHSIILEGRLYYGLGNIFPASKADTFAASRSMSIQVTMGYMFRLK